MNEQAVIRNEGGHSRRIGRKGLAMVEDMAHSGLSLTTIAKNLRISTRTFYEIRQRQPEVADAVERGYSAMEDELVQSLTRRALDDSRRDGTVAAIFLLRSRRGYQGDKVPASIVINNNDNRKQTIALPAPEEREAYMNRIKELNADG